MSLRRVRPRLGQFGAGLLIGFLLGGTVGALAISPAQIVDSDGRSEPKYLWGWEVLTIHGEYVCYEPEVGNLKLYCNTSLRR